MEIQRIGDQDILLTFEEAASLLRVSRATMYRLLASGDLVGHKVGRGWRFYKTDVHQFVVNRRLDGLYQSSPDSLVARTESQFRDISSELTA